MANFATIQDVEDFLQIDIPAAKIDSANQALEWATAAIQNYCNQWIWEVIDDQITMDCAAGVARLLLPELPVIEVGEVIEDGELLTVNTDYKLGQWGILHRVGQNWAEGIQIIIITYSHGYYDIPDDIIAVCARAASRAYQAGLTAEESAGILGVASKTLGDWSVSFQSAAGGGIGEGLLGASGARFLLLSEKDILNKYRVKKP
jgi:hypothetical protein